MKRHISRNHESENLFECTDCEHQFSTAFDLKRHIKRVHDKESSKSNAKTFLNQIFSEYLPKSSCLYFKL